MLALPPAASVHTDDRHQGCAARSLPFPVILVTLQVRARRSINEKERLQLVALYEAIHPVVGYIQCVTWSHVSTCIEQAAQREVVKNMRLSREMCRGFHVVAETDLRVKRQSSCRQLFLAAK